MSLLLTKVFLLKTSFGEVGTDIPRNRNTEFDPQFLKKQQTTLTGDIEEKIEEWKIF